MGLRYDFDMAAVTPKGMPDRFGDLAVTGVAGEKLAMFRDPRTVAALKQADSIVRTFFTDSGFALQHHDSGAPPGTFPVSDEEARIAIIERLTANVQHHDLANARWGNFDFTAFMDALDSAKPLPDELRAPATATPAAPQYDRELAQARITAQKRKGKRMLAMGGMLLGLILLFYAASFALGQ